MITPASKKRGGRKTKSTAIIQPPSEAPSSPIEIKEPAEPIAAADIVVEEPEREDAGGEEGEAEPLKVTNAVEAVQKRVRAANKKLVSLFQ